MASVDHLKSRSLLSLSFLLFICLFPTIVSQQCIQIKVDSLSGRDGEDCLLGQGSCSSLEYVFTFLETNSSFPCAEVSVVPRNESYVLPYKEFNVNVDLSLRNANRTLDGRVRVVCSPGEPGSLRGGDNVTATIRIRNVSDVVVEGFDFQGCQRPIRFESMPRLTIRDSSFSNFSASAISVLNVWNITVESCRFSDSFTAAPDPTYRGNAAGLSIEYNDSPYSSGTIDVRGSQFYGNLAGEPDELILLGETESITGRFDTLNRGLFFARGGGMGLYIQNSSSSVVPTILLTVEDCEFVNNKARAVGGGFYIAPFGVDVNHVFTFRNTSFIGNSADDIGGGFFTGFPSKFTFPHRTTVTFEGCRFIGNVAGTAGGIGVQQAYPQGSGSLVEIKNTYFYQNRATRNGAAVQFDSHAHLLVFEAANYLYLIENCTFDNNQGDGILSTDYTHIEFRGNNTFSRNIGVALEVSASLILLNGSIKFEDNYIDSLRGGALFINTFGQIRLKRGSKMEFFNNTGRIGAAIVVEVQEYSIPLSDLAGNPQCFLVYEEPNVSPHDWEDVEILFANNTAQVGSVIYSSFLNICSWFSNNITTSIFNIEEFLTWRVFQMTYGPNYNKAHGNVSDERFYVQTEAISLNVSKSVIKMWPGQRVSLKVSAADQFANPTYVILRLTDERVSVLNGSFKEGDLSQNSIFTTTPDLIPLLPTNEMLEFHVSLPGVLVNSFRANASSVQPVFLIDTPYNVRNIEESVKLHVSMLPCPPGFSLESGTGTSHLDVNTNYECECGINDPEIIQCSPESTSIILEESLWVGLSSSSRSDAKFGMVMLPCPPTHCACVKNFSPALVDCVTVFDYEDPNAQCYDNRSGVLCGQCKPGKGVGVLSTNCLKPVQYGYLLFIPLIVFQVVVTIVIVIAGVKIPAVLKSLLFYLQVTPYLATFFPSSFFYARDFLYCFTALLALYFPWDFSMWDGMPALASFAFVYEIFLPVGVCVTITLAVRSHYRKRFWSGVWSLILITSGVLLYTAFASLHCVHLPLDSDGQRTPWKWYYDGNVYCFNDAHIPLGLFSIAVLLAYAGLTIVLFVYTFRPKLKHPEKFGDFLAAVHRGYRKGVEWYGPYELFRRFVLILFIVYLPGVSVFPICVVFVLFLVHLYASPYMYWWQNALETINFCILLTLLLFRSVAVTNGVLTIPGNNAVSVVRGSTLEQTDNLSGFLIFWYYLPIAVTLVASVAVLLYRLWHGPFGKKFKASKDIFAATNPQAIERPDSLAGETVPSTELNTRDSAIELVSFSVMEADDIVGSDTPGSATS